MGRKFLLSVVVFSLLFIAMGTEKSYAQVAKVGDTEYATIDEAISAWTNGTTLTLLSDVTLSDVIKLSSTEHHTLDLGTYTMTAASGKHAIEITCEGRTSASYAITVNADATNPGGITATGKSCIYYNKSGSTKDRPIIRIYNGVFNGSYSIYSKSNGNTNCPQIWIYGGIFNGNVNLTKNMLRVFGGVFHGWINCTGDSSAYREISGGRFKSWQFMTADADTKFWVGTSKANYDVGVYVDDEGYLVVGGPVITEFSPKYQAKASNYSKWSSYLKYSSAAQYGLFYTNAEKAIEKHGADNVTVYEHAESATELAGNTAVNNFNNNIDLPSNVSSFSIELADIEGESGTATKVTFNVEPKDANGNKVSNPASAITFRLPVPASWDGKAKVYHDNELLGKYAIATENYVEVASANFSEFAVEQIPPLFDGEGTETSPYLINSIDKLVALRDEVNAGEAYEGKYFQLTDNITLTDEWTSIGNGSRSSKSYTGNSFKGVFNGDNKTISGLTITSTTGDDAAIGLFGVVDGGTVKNLNLTDVNINVANSDLAGAAIGMMLNGATADNITVSGSVIGHDGVGGIVGRLVINGTISDCTNNAAVTSAYGGIGGIVGKAYYEDGNNTEIFASITNCINNGTITAPMYVGGIVGLARANVSGCVNNGAVVGGTQTGGIIGQLIAAGTVSANENEAKISGKNHLAGIIGDYSQSTAYTYYNVSIANNINRGEVAATEQCAAIMGCNNIDGFTAMTATGNVSYYWHEGLELFGNPEDMVIDETNRFINEFTVSSQAELQAVLDNCRPGTTILLNPAEYGVVYMRPNPDNAATKEVDWQGNNYRYETYSCFENLTIKGVNNTRSAEAAVIDAIVIEGGTYYNTNHSQAATYPVMLSLIELKNVVVEDVTFTGKGGYDPQGYGNVINLSEQNIKVDGLTVRNCVLNDTENNARLIYRTGSTTHVHNYTYNGESFTFVPDMKNITVEGCTFNGGYMGLELRETENLVISGNAFNNVTSRDILLPVNSGCTYTGKVDVIDNTSDGAGNRFLRASGIGDATLTVTGNSIVNYQGEDADFIKADGIAEGNTPVIENNTLEGENVAVVLNNGVAMVVLPVAQIGTTGYATLQDAVNAAQNGEIVTVLSNIELTAQNAQEMFKPAYNRESYCGIYIPDDKAIVLELNGFTISYQDEYFDVDNVMVLNLGNLTINDNSEEKTGKITYKAEEGNSTYSKFYSTIFNCGTLTVNGGTIENTADAYTDVTNAIDNHSRLSHEYGNDCILTVNGGILTGAYYYAIRQYTHYLEGVKNRVVINDGIINGGVYMQHGDSWYYADPNKNRLNVDCYLTINGGDFNVVEEGIGKIRSACNNPDNELWGLEINGGNFEAHVQLRIQRGVYYTDGVSGSTTPAETAGARNAEWLQKNGGFVSGGTFAQIGDDEDPTSNLDLFLTAGFELVDNNDGTYGVQLADYVRFPEGVTAENYKEKFGDNTVTDGTNYYATMIKALEGIHLTGENTLYCKPGADVGEMTHGHICASLTVYGNGAYVSGGEQDFELGQYNYCHNGANTCSGITEDLTLNVNYLHGAGAWGTHNVEYTFNMLFNNCEDMGRIYMNGIGGENNITLNNCTFTSNIAGDCKLYSNANGTINVTNCAFSNVNLAINLNHKVAGEQIVNITNTTFDNVGYADYEYAAPVRVLSSVEGATSNVTINGCTFTNTVANKLGQDADILLDYAISTTVVNVSGTSAKVIVEKEENVNSQEVVVSNEQNATFTNGVEVAQIGDEKYTSLSAAFAAVTDDAQTVVILSDVTEELTGAYLRGNITTEGDSKVTINLTNEDWLYCPYTFVLGENITLNVPALFYYAGGAQINGTVVAGAYYQRYANTKLTINEPGSMKVTTETFIVRNMDNDPNAGIYIVGDNNDETIGLDASVVYFYQGMINAKDADIKVGTYWQTNETDNEGSANLVLDNSNMTVSVNEHNMKATGNSTMTLTNDSHVTVAGGYQGVAVSMDETSSMTKNGKSIFVSKINTYHYTSFQAAVAAAQNDETIQLLWSDGDAPIAMNASLYGKNVTVTGTATVDWSKGFLFVGRGGEGDATLTFDNANLTSASNQATYGIHVSGREKDTDNKYDGTVVINNSTIDLDYLINKGVMTLDNSNLTVKNGFAVGGRPASETESGADATATITLNNVSKLVVNNHNGMGLGYEAIGVMNVNSGSTFECTQNFLVTAKGTMNVNGGNVEVDGTLTNNGVVNVNEGENTLNITTLDGGEDKEINFLDGAIIRNSTVGGEVFVAGKVTFRGDNTFAMLYDFGTLTDYYGTTANMEWTVEEGASLTLTNKARYGLGYGDNVTINGNITNALEARESPTEADRSLFMHGLVAQESKGWNCDSKLTVENAYVVLGSNNSFGNKPGDYGGSYTFNFKNSVVDASRITFYDALSVTEFTFESSDVKIGTFMTRDEDSKFTLINSVVLSTATTNGTDEGNYNAGELTLVNSSLTYSAAFINTGTLNIGENSTFTAPSVVNNADINFTAPSAKLVAQEGLTINLVFENSNYYVVEYANGAYTVKQVTFEQTSSLAQGWNWFSSYINLNSNEGLETLQNALGTAGIEIKSHNNGYVRYESAYDLWWGSLSAVAAEQMYMIRTSAQVDDMKLTGEMVDYNSVEITLKPGWNWIGFPMSEAVSVTDALKGLEAKPGDQIKSKDNGFASYNSQYGWGGTLSTLNPGEGYMYQSYNSETTELFYSAGTRGELKSNVTTDGNHWIPNAGQYANNMTMTAMVEVEGGDYEVAAFVNGEVRGSARPIYIEALDAHILFLTIHGEDVEEMTFRYYDTATGEEFDLNDRMNYSNDAIVGTVAEPYIFSRGTTGIGEASLSEVNIYPNPTTTGKEINLQATCDKVEVFNALGVKVAEYHNVDSLDAFETAGIYVIRLTNDGDVKHCRVVVK